MFASQSRTVENMFSGISRLFDTVQVKGETLSRVHQPVLFPIPDYDGVKDMRFVALRGIKAPAPKPAEEIAAAEPAPAPAPEPPPPAPTTGEIFLDTGDDECEVRLDGDKTPRRSNGAFELPEGKHLLSLYLAQTNYNHTLLVDVKAGQKERLRLHLRGRLAVESFPAASGQRAADLDVYLDGRSVGRTSLRLKDVAAGTHTLMVVAGDVRKTRKIEIRPDSPLLVRYKIVRQAVPARSDDSGAEDVTF